MSSARSSNHLNQIKQKLYNFVQAKMTQFLSRSGTGLHRRIELNVSINENRVILGRDVQQTAIDDSFDLCLLGILCSHVRAATNNNNTSHSTRPLRAFARSAPSGANINNIFVSDRSTAAFSAKSVMFAKSTTSSCVNWP